MTLCLVNPQGLVSFLIQILYLGDPSQEVVQCEIQYDVQNFLKPFVFQILVIQMIKTNQENKSISNVSHDQVFGKKKNWKITRLNGWSHDLISGSEVVSYFLCGAGSPNPDQDLQRNKQDHCTFCRRRLTVTSLITPPLAIPLMETGKDI